MHGNQNTNANKSHSGKIEQTGAPCAPAVTSGSQPARMGFFKTTNAMTAQATILVVFDGTSHFIIDVTEYERGKIIARFYDIDMAQECVDKLNRECIDRVH